MMKGVNIMNRKLTIILDCDDVLYECAGYAAKLANEEKGYIPPITLDEISGWGRSGTRTDIIFDYMNKESFYRNQPLMDGAVNFVNELISLGCEIIICTAVAGRFATTRFERIEKDFPMIPQENIMVGCRKDLLFGDFLLDDALHNVENSRVRHPIVFARPWNRYTSERRVNDYNEFLQMVKEEISREKMNIFLLSKYNDSCEKTKALC